MEPLPSPPRESNTGKEFQVRRVPKRGPLSWAASSDEGEGKYRASAKALGRGGGCRRQEAMPGVWWWQSRVVRGWAGRKTADPRLGPPIINCVSSGSSLHIFEPQFPSQWRIRMAPE